MRMVIMDDKRAVAEWSARYVRKRILSFNPGPDRYFVLGLPTGSTPLGMYQRLVEFHKAGELSFKFVKTFNMDEYVGLAADHPESYRTYMFENFFKHIDIEPQNVHLLDGNAADLEKECADFEAAIDAAGGVELFIGERGWMR